MDHELAEHEALFSANEDGTGIWEVLWTLNTLIPDRPSKYVRIWRPVRSERWPIAS